MKPESLKILERQIELKMIAYRNCSERLSEWKDNKDSVYLAVSKIRQTTLNELYDLLQILKLEEPKKFKKYEVIFEKLRIKKK